MNQGGTADKCFYSSLTEFLFLSGAFLFCTKHPGQEPPGKPADGAECVRKDREVLYMLLTKRWRRSGRPQKFYFGILFKTERKKTAKQNKPSGNSI